ncbi:MAG: hypothetical protein IJ550_06765 [Bacteroidaceae bacterium]|nr:hypothetical protein [Bacteroidaceae bacterium]
MKTAHLFLLPFLFLFVFASCEKVEEVPEDTPPIINAEGDSIVVPIVPIGDPDSLSIEDLLDYVDENGSTEESAYSVHDILHFLPKYLEYYDASGYPDCYVRGFIVGFVAKNKNSIAHAVFSSGDVETNIVIADSPDEIDYNNCIAVQLSTSSKGQKEVREGLNLFAHPENLGAYVILHGTVTKYMGTLGLKSVNDAVIYIE